MICDREAEVRSARLRFSFSVALVRVALKVVMKVGDLELSVRSSNRVSQPRAGLFLCKAARDATGRLRNIVARGFMEVF